MQTSYLNNHFYVVKISVLTVQTKVVYTDYQYAVVYSCNHVLTDGSCASDKVAVDVMSRDLDSIPLEVEDKLKKLAVETCFEPGDFVASDYQGMF